VVASLEYSREVLQVKNHWLWRYLGLQGTEDAAPLTGSRRFLAFGVAVIVAIACIFILVRLL
jgi:hypothetical protein